MDAISSALGIERAGLKDWPVAVIGAGGAARAIVAGLSQVGAKIKIYNRTVEKAKRLAAEFGCLYGRLDELSGMDAKLIVNCTSVGMYPEVDRSPVPCGCLKKDMVIFDTVYNPVETLLLKEGGKAGAKVIDGVAMFVNQAAGQFKLFTGQDANLELIGKIAFENLGG